MIIKSPPLLTPAEASELTGYYTGTLAKLERTGVITAVRTPLGHRRYHAESIQALIIERGRIVARPVPIRLDGCTCQAIAGSHAHGCPWSAR